MKRASIALLPVMAAFAIPAFVLAQQAAEPPWAGLDDVHLEVIQRTDAERERIAAVTAWPEDFRSAWAFEEGLAPTRAADTPGEDPRRVIELPAEVAEQLRAEMRDHMDTLDELVGQPLLQVVASNQR